MVSQGPALALQKEKWYVYFAPPDVCLSPPCHSSSQFEQHRLTRTVVYTEYYALNNY